MRQMILPLALSLTLASPVASQDLFDEASGGSWHYSKRVTVKKGVFTNSHIRLNRHPVQRRASISVRTHSGSDYLIPEILALKIDGTVETFECELRDLDSSSAGYGSFDAEAFCQVPWELSEKLLAAKTIEVQINTSERRMKPVVLTAKQVGKLQALRKKPK